MNSDVLQRPQGRLGSSTRKGFVYFIRAAGPDAPIKIGFAANVKRRFAGLCCSSPVPLVLLGTVEGVARTERWWHRAFTDERLHGEWFRPSKRLLEAIERGALEEEPMPKRDNSVQDWFDEEEARTPGFLESIDGANLRERIAKDLRALREAAGLTQAQLGEKLKVKQPVVARIESGQAMPDLMTVHRYAHALGYLVDPPSYRTMPGRVVPKAVVAMMGAPKRGVKKQKR